MKFPVTITHRTGKVKIYAPAKSFPYYRLAYALGGVRQRETFNTYSEAKAAGETKAKEIHEKPAAASLSAKQAQDALAALERLEAFRQSTGRNLSLLGVVSDFLEVAGKLGKRSMREAVAGYLQSVVTVKAKGIAEAVEDFITSRQHKSESQNGKRAQMSASYAVHVNSWLRDFAGTFTGTLVSDLAKEHLNAYFTGQKDKGSKNRNDRRAALKMFLTWAARQDYLPVTHRLFEADGMAREIVEAGDTGFFTPTELQTLLNKAGAELRPVIALAGLAGLRGQEIMRLEWADVWRVADHIEVSARNAKTRQRRLVSICPALAAWLEPYREKSGLVFPRGVNVYQLAFLNLRKELKIKDRNNGLRHGFCTYHFALHANENLTAAQAGNSPAMIHAHYKGLATKADAEKWFNVLPVKSSKADK